MADKHQLDLLKQGSQAWNSWRQRHPQRPMDLNKINCSGMSLPGIDLSKAILCKADLHESDLTAANLSQSDLREAYLKAAVMVEANLSKASLRKATLNEAILSKAVLTQADLHRADLTEANLCLSHLSNAQLQRANLDHAYLRKSNLTQTNLHGANLRQANLAEANLHGADLSEADLSGASLYGANLRNVDLRRANLSETDLRGADLSGCAIYATAAWGIQLQNTRQEDIVITRDNEPTISVDSLSLAQFISLWLSAEEIRQHLTPSSSQIVLLAGNFTNAAKASLTDVQQTTLAALKTALRAHAYLPITFDTQKASSEQILATFKVLAPLARFILADTTQAKELTRALAGDLSTLNIPIKPFSHAGKLQTGPLLDNVEQSQHLLPLYQYAPTAEPDTLSDMLYEELIAPAEQRAQLARHSALTLSIAALENESTTTALATPQHPLLTQIGSTLTNIANIINPTYAHFTKWSRRHRPPQKPA